eukprot:jgi/Psemu1/247091/estExt_Genewise1.C_9420020
MVKYLKSMEDYEAMMQESKTKLVVIDFTATWCPPCRMIAPIFEQMAAETPDAAFYKVDVDDASDVAAVCNIEAMPTFQFYKDGEMVEVLTGANPAKLSELLQKHL